MDSDPIRRTAAPSLVLVVDDHALVRDLVVRMLNCAGHQTLAVSDADQAFALWSRSPAIFKLIVTDILMPSSLDGLTLGRLIQTREPGMPVLYISGSEHSDASATLVEGRNFFRKPFDPGKFLAAVERLVEGRAQPASAACSDELAAPAAG